MPVVASDSFLRHFGHSIGDEVKISVSGRRLTAVLVDTVDFFPTLDSYNDRFLVADLETVRAHTNLGMARTEITANEMWLRTDVEGDERVEFIEQLREGRPFQIGRAIDTVEDLAVAQIDPLVLAGWRALLLIAFGAILVLSSLGFLVHAYISFRNRELQFALMRTMGFSTRQLVSLMWLEQALVIIVGIALGTWNGRPSRRDDHAVPGPRRPWRPGATAVRNRGRLAEPAGDVCRNGPDIHRHNHRRNPLHPTNVVIPRSSASATAEAPSKKGAPIRDALC